VSLISRHVRRGPPGRPSIRDWRETRGAGEPPAAEVDEIVMARETHTCPRCGRSLEGDCLDGGRCPAVPCGFAF
jgi:hypothetical protein